MRWDFSSYIYIYEEYIFHIYIHVYIYSFYWLSYGYSSRHIWYMIYICGDCVFCILWIWECVHAFTYTGRPEKNTKFLLLHPDQSLSVTRSLLQLILLPRNLLNCPLRILHDGVPNIHGHVRLYTCLACIYLEF